MKHMSWKASIFKLIIHPFHFKEVHEISSQYQVCCKFAIFIFQKVDTFHRKYPDQDNVGTYLRHMKMTPNSWAATNGRRGEEKPTNEEAWWRWLPVVLILVHASQHQHSYANFLPLLYPACGHSEMLVSWQLLAPVSAWWDYWVTSVTAEWVSGDMQRPLAGDGEV